MEPTDDPLIALFVAWRADIDSEPYAHEPPGLAPTLRRRPVCAGPGDRRGPRSIPCQHPPRPT